MKQIYTWLLLLALAHPVRAADDFPIHVYPCPKAAVAPVLDGKLNDAVWQQAPLVSGFINYESGDLANPQTSFRVLWDDQRLYFGLRCDEPLMEKVLPVRYTHDEHAVFSSETIEVFTAPDHNNERYYQLAFSIAGSLYDGEGTATNWNSDAEVTTFKGQDFWSAELAVPWAPMKSQPHAGKVVGFNVNRDRNVGGHSWHTWARVDFATGFHDPERFGHLVLSGTPEVIGKLSAEFRKGERTGPIVVFSAEGFAQTTYAKLAAEAVGQGEKLVAQLRAEGKREQSPETAAEIQRRLDSYQTRLEELKADLAGSMDAARWTRLDIALQEWLKTLRKTIAEARLKVLLDNI